MPRKKKKSKITVKEMRDHIREKLDTMDDVMISRVYEAVTGCGVGPRIDENYIRLIT